MENSSAIEKNLTVRFAEPRDAETFARWAAENPNIPQKDALSVTKDRNATSIALVIEEDDKVVLFVPFYCQMNLGFIGFNPESDARQRIRGLEAMQKALTAFAQEHGINEITVQTAKDYPIAKWAIKHGFEPENRQTFKFWVPGKAEAAHV